MINFIPIFPLNIVVYPGEKLNLHIFEERYKQLIHECRAENKPFGIPTVLNGKPEEMGTLVDLVEIVQVHDSGSMDITTRGVSVFRMLETIQVVPDKLYSGAIVDYPANATQQKKILLQKVLTDIRELHRLLKVSKDFGKPDTALRSYDLAHHVGLSLNEEYELLQLLQENQRLEYLKRHLGKVLPVVSGMEELKERIQLNGHFRELKGFNLDF
ncbi:LON peptidase substrate-binding domain-containing protein [Deminuibacter soli]|uniref:Peptidase S16 n=1 Tax=Deminuibacter soli TaxID=2291815 RepID=A0A3E1NRD3_9BACT|nr:LON peptidase substrate-binding domain-containing protein [Deminuibacter soli]RFM30457.1 peptidase S16 [Deminuibacter soli]